MNTGRARRGARYAPWALLAATALLSAVALVDLAQIVQTRFLSRLAPGDSGYPWSDALYFHMAGEFWRTGASPYTQEFIAQFGVTYGREANEFFYLPNTFPIAALLSLPSDGIAVKLWFLICVGLLVASAWFFVASITPQRAGRTPGRLPGFAIMLAVLFAANTTEISLKLGQTSVLVLFGACLLCRGLQDRRSFLAALGLSLVFLKPQFGAPVLVAMLAAGHYWRVFWGAVVLSVLYALPVLITQNPLTGAADILAALASYGDKPENSPLYTTGLPHLAYRLAGIELPSLAMLGAAMVLSAGLGTSLRRGNGPPMSARDRALALAFGPLLLTLMLVPLHEYDFILVLPFLAALVLTAMPILRFAAAGLLILLLKATTIGLLLVPAADYWAKAPVVAVAYTVLGIGVVALFATRLWHGSHHETLSPRA